MDFEKVAAIHSAYKATTVNATIDPNDVMYATGQGHYYITGETAINIILSGLTLGGTQKVTRILDLACGHGRVARHLRAAFPEAELYFCDIDHQAVNFCAGTFDGYACYSVANLTEVDLPKDIDIIWIGSLFTHVDRQRTSDWLQFLANHLRADGNLVATFHGYFSAAVTKFGNGDVAKMKREFEATGYGYARASKEADYGISLSKPSAILDIADSIPGTKVLAYTERGWAYNHDVLTLTKTDRVKPWGG